MRRATAGWLMAAALLGIFAMAQISQPFPARLDMLGGVPTVDWVHHEVHDGHTFLATDLQTINAGVPNRTVWTLTTAANAAHTLCAVTTNGEVEIYVNKSPTISAAGVLGSPVNLNTASAVVPVTTVHRNVTLSADGTKHGVWLVGTSAPASRVGGGVRLGQESLIGPSSTYAVIAVATNNGTKVAIECSWYEETP